MNMRKWMVIAGWLAWSCSAAAEDSPLQIALTLGDLVGSEEICDISIDQSRLGAYITEHVSAGDMSFAGTMTNAADVMPRTYKRMTQSMKTAHCVQMRRLADALGFSKK